MKVRRITIAEIAIEEMIKEDTDLIDIGCLSLLGQIYKRGVQEGAIRKGVKDHPLDRNAYIMAALRRSPQFRLRGYIDYPGYKGLNKCALLEIKT